MKIKYFLLTAVILLTTNTFAQIGIGTNTPAASAALEVSSISNNKGILIPRITATQKDAISNPAEGLMIYQTTAPVGFYFYTGNSWILLVSQTDLNLKVAKVSGKDLSSNDYTSAEKTKVSNLSGTNTGDQDLSALATAASVALKADATDLTNGLALKVDKVANKDLSSNDYTSAEKTKVSNLSGTNTGDQDLSSLATIASVTLKAPLASPVFTGTPSLPSGTRAITQTPGDNSTKLATTAYADAVAAAALTSSGVADNSVSSAKIADGTIATADIANAAITNEKIAAVAASKITGVIPVSSGGTGETTVPGILSTLGFAGNNIAIGRDSGTPTQGENMNTVSIGGGAGDTNQGQSAIAIGYVSGNANQGANALAIGGNTAQSNQGTQAVALGFAAGQNSQGAYSVAVGSFAGNSQVANSIAINASGNNLNPANAGFYVDPIRSAANTGVLLYNTNTKEVTTSADISGNATNVTGTVAVANGGTGANTLTGLVKGNGTSALTAAIAGTDYLAPTGSAASLTNFPTLNQNTTGTADNVTGRVAVANGGTGQTSYTDGQLLIGNTTGNTLTKATLTQGTGISITNTGGGITIANTAGMPSGTTVGDMNYWNGTAWVRVAAGSNWQILTFYNGAPAWKNISGAAFQEPTDVYNPATRKIWMDRNLGATGVATYSSDPASYGGLYQWGRGTDGHQIRTSGTTVTLSSSDNPGNSNFILAPNDSSNDWRSPQNNNLWQGVSGINNPCPSGYRLPTHTEWDAERLSWNSNDPNGAMASPLKLPMAGFRRQTSGSLDTGNPRGFYWSSSVSETNSGSMFFLDTSASTGFSSRALGLSVRCIKD